MIIVVSGTCSSAFILQYLSLVYVLGTINIDMIYMYLLNYFDTVQIIFSSDEAFMEKENEYLNIYWSFKTKS